MSKGDFVAALSISNEVYVYNQIQSDQDGVHVFHIIYDHRGEWDSTNYDISKYRYVGSYVNVMVTISDGRQFLPTKKTAFRLLDVKSKCQKEAKEDKELYDLRICNFLPKGGEYDSMNQTSQHISRSIYL